MNEIVENKKLEEIKHLHGFDEYIAHLISLAAIQNISPNCGDISFWVNEVREKIDSKIQKTARNWVT